MTMDTPMLIRALRARAASEQMQIDEIRDDALVALLREARERLEELAGRTEPYRESKPFDFDEAVAQHVANQTPGALLDTYVFQARYKTLGMAEAGESGYLSSSPDGQSIDQTLGLLAYATVQAQRYALEVRRPDEDGQ